MRRVRTRKGCTGRRSRALWLFHVTGEGDADVLPREDGRVIAAGRTLQTHTLGDVGSDLVGEQRPAGLPATAEPVQRSRRSRFCWSWKDASVSAPAVTPRACQATITWL